MLNRIWSKLKSSSAVTPGFAKVFLKSFNLCIFSSLVILSFHHQIIFYNLPHIPVELQYRLIIPLINALLNGIVCVALYYYFAGRKFTSYSYRSENKPALFLTAFIAGFVSIYISFNAVTTYLISALIIYAAYFNIRSFIRKLSHLLYPNTLAGSRDLSEFTVFFINLLVTFTVINISLNTIHLSLGTQVAFNFGEGIAGILDAIYFALITMTTVGYGDIYPRSPVARIIVGLECLISYLMLGIMISIISRGIESNPKDKSSPEN